jgi:hypothetical protein
MTNRPKLSADTTPRVVASRFQSMTVEIPAARRPTIPSPPIGIRSPGERKASAVMAAMPAIQTHAIGTIAR